MQRSSCGRGRARAERLDAGACRRECVERDIDAIEVAKILAAVLQVVDDLQRRAQRVVRRPGGPALAVHVEHEAPDRHGRVAAVVDQVVPVARSAAWSRPCGTRSSRSCAWRGGSAALGERARSRTASGIVVAAAEQVRFQPVEQRELLVGRERRMIGDVVGDAHEFVEGQDDAAMARVDEPRRDRKVLVAVALARTQLAGRASLRTLRLHAALPVAALAGGVLIGGVEREEHVERE